MLTRSLSYGLAAGALALALVTLSPSRAGTAPLADPRAAAARLEAAKATYVAVQATAAAGGAPSESVYTWSVRWLMAELDAGGRNKAAIVEHLTRMRGLESAVAAKFTSGAASRADVLATTYYRIEAELWSVRNAVR